MLCTILFPFHFLLLLWVLEVGLQSLPRVSVVISLHLLAAVQCPLSNAHHQARLKHESHRSLPNLLWSQFSSRCPLVSRSIWSVSGHDVVQRSTSWLETTANLGIVVTLDQAHELRHGVAVVPRWAESALCDQPTWWEDDKVSNGGSLSRGWSSEDGEDRWIWVVVANGADGVEATEIVLVWVVVSVPCDNVEWSVLLLGSEELAIELGEDGPVIGGVLVESSNWSLEIACVGEAVGTDWAETWELEVALVELENITTDWAVWKSNTVTDTTWDDSNLVWTEEDVTELGLDVENTVLENDEEVTVGRVEGLVAHVLACREDDDAQSGLHCWGASTTKVFERVDPVLGLIHIEWIPAELVWNLVEWDLEVVLGGGIIAVLVCSEVGVGCSWENAVKP